MFGRNGESPIVVLAPSSPADCFLVAIEAARLAVRAMTPVFILSDGFIANSAEPWSIPDADEIEPIVVQHPAARSNGDSPFLPYHRNPETLARAWATPGIIGLEHRLGGLSKAKETGNVSYDPDHNEAMNQARVEKVARLSNFIAPTEVVGAQAGNLLVLSWGGTFGAVRVAASMAHNEGKSVGHVYLRHLNPFPRNLGDILHRFDQVLIPELNLGQLALLIRGKYGVDVEQYNRLHARPREQEKDNPSLILGRHPKGSGVG